MPRQDDESLGRLFFELNQATQDFQARDKDESIQKRTSSI